MTDNEKTIKDYLKIVDNNIECGWYDAALEYLEKILEIDCKCDQAWILKAQVLDKTGQTSKAVATWLNALYFMSPENNRNYRNTLASSYWPNFFLNFDHLLAQQRKDEDFPYAELNRCNEILNIFTVKGRVPFNRAMIYSDITEKMYNAARSHFGNNEISYGTTAKSRSRVRMNNYVNSAGYCYHWLIKAASLMRGQQQIEEKLSWVIDALTKTLDAESWTYQVESEDYKRDQVLDAEQKKKVVDAIERCNSIIAQSRQTSVESIVAELDQLREPEESARGIRYYWLSHEEEKNNLIKEKENLSAEIEHLSDVLANLDVLKEIEVLHETQQQQKQLEEKTEKDRNALSVFDRKGKKEMQAQIDDIRKTIKENDERLSELQKQLQEKTDEITAEKEACKTRISRIDEQFHIKRERIEDETVNYIGTLGEISCRQIAENLAFLMKGVMETADDSRTTIRLHPSLEDTYCFRTQTGEMSNVFVFDRKDKDDKPEMIVLKHHSYTLLNKDEIMSMVRTGVYMLRSLVENLTISEAEKILTRVLCDPQDSTCRIGNLSLEYAYDFSNHCIIFRKED